MSKPKPSKFKIIQSIEPLPFQKNDDKDYPNFSFRYACTKNYCIKKCSHSQFKSLFNTLRMLSESPWNKISGYARENLGFEHLNQKHINAAIPSVVGIGEKIMVFRFGGTERMAGIRRDNTFFILFVDIKRTLYNHGS